MTPHRKNQPRTNTLGAALLSTVVCGAAVFAQRTAKVPREPIRIELPGSKLWFELAQPADERPVGDGTSVTSRPTVLRPFVVLVGTRDHRPLRDQLTARGYRVATLSDPKFLDAEPFDRARAQLAGAELSKLSRIHYHVARNRLLWVALDGHGTAARAMVEHTPREVLALLDLGERDNADAPTSTTYPTAREPSSSPTDVAASITQLHRRGLPDGRAARAALATLDDFHEAATCADQARYFGHFTEDGVFLGTDATERWTAEEFRKWAGFAFRRESAWMFTPFEQHVYVSADGQFAWFDEQLDSRSYGTCRGSGVLRKVGQRWKVAQYNLTVPIPNDLMKSFVQKIRAFLAKQATPKEADREPNSSSPSEKAKKTKTSSRVKSPVSLEEQIQQLRKLDLGLFPQLRPDDLQFFYQREELEAQPYRLLVETMSEELQRPPGGRIARRLWMCDYERIEDHGAYRDMLAHLEMMTSRAVGATDIRDFVDVDAGVAWLKFRLGTEAVRWDFRVDDDWVDPSIFAKYGALLEASGSSYRLYESLEPEYGQSSMYATLAPADYDELRRLTGIRMRRLPQQ